MREFKFRLILEGKIVGYEKHSLAYHNGKKQIIAMHSPDNEEWWNTVHDPTKWIQHDDKEQYIGRKDKNSEAICEGDKIRLNFLKKSRTGIMKYADKWATFYIATENQYGAGIALTEIHSWYYSTEETEETECEIIGTIHD